MEIWRRIQSLYLDTLLQFFTNNISRNQICSKPHVHTIFLGLSFLCSGKFLGLIPRCCNFPMGTIKMVQCAWLIFRCHDQKNKGILSDCFSHIVYFPLCKYILGIYIKHCTNFLLKQMSNYQNYSFMRPRKDMHTFSHPRHC